jgi:hypothetical protein
MADMTLSMWMIPSAQMFGPRLCQIVVVGCCPSNRFKEIIGEAKSPVSGPLVEAGSHDGASAGAKKTGSIGGNDYEQP